MSRLGRAALRQVRPYPDIDRSAGVDPVLRACDTEAAPNLCQRVYFSFRNAVRPAKEPSTWTA